MCGMVWRTTLVALPLDITWNTFLRESRKVQGASQKSLCVSLCVNKANLHFKLVGIEMIASCPKHEAI